MEAFKETLLSSFIVFENQLNGQKKSELHKLRQKAFEAFEKYGFPTRKDEDWKYTNLKPIIKHDYKIFHPKEQKLQLDEARKYFLSETDTYRIVFVDGYYASWLSLTTHHQYDICTFSALINRYPEIADEYVGKLINHGDSFTALNTAFAREGAYIFVPDNKIVDKPIEILHFTTPHALPAFQQPRSLLVLGKNSRATVIERHISLSANPVFTNSATEVFLHTGAILDHYKIQTDHYEASLIDNTVYQLQGYSVLNLTTASLGGKFVRNNPIVKLIEPMAEAHLWGLTKIDSSELADHHTSIEHIAPHCQSNELYKGIFGGRSTGIFNGKVYVAPHAQKTNAFQQNNNIVLSDKATVNTKPQLEIFANDVKCSHGCTVGQMDENAMFYLRQRGIAADKARALLLLAFAGEIVDKIQLPELRQYVKRIFNQKNHIDFDFDL
ncbi:Fe-S cluster assembly protein SufD [Schleiferia thermophila]|jgi:Fe-S cluster assembly protein SufD|uniref:Fe-S cluster assembly protein SufD n=1 Tax=Schleiferia thermophila TaxID=884107 RepID=UPI0004E72B0F|nr:Fe-S cluster assembly protein SufD [Schleiferia thermophila]KFD38611.1 FeS assembly protein SufD [Schleiferia thermophila str. Yellowstone]